MGEGDENDVGSVEENFRDEINLFPSTIDISPKTISYIFPFGFMPEGSFVG